MCSRSQCNSTVQKECELVCTWGQGVVTEFVIRGRGKHRCRIFWKKGQLIWRGSGTAWEESYRASPIFYSRVTGYSPSECVLLLYHWKRGLRIGEWGTRWLVTPPARWILGCRRLYRLGLVLGLVRQAARKLIWLRFTFWLLNTKIWFPFPFSHCCSPPVCFASCCLAHGLPQERGLYFFSHLTKSIFPNLNP